MEEFILIKSDEGFGSEMALSVVNRYSGSILGIPLDGAYLPHLIHTCLEERFGSTSKPPNNIYVILILGKNAAI